MCRTPGQRSTENGSIPQWIANLEIISILARQLGGACLPFKGTDVVSTIHSFVQEYGVSHIVMGRSQQPWYRRWFGQSLLDKLLQTVTGVDVIVVDNTVAAKEG